MGRRVRFCVKVRKLGAIGIFWWQVFEAESRDAAMHKAWAEGFELQAVCSQEEYRNLPMHETHPWRGREQVTDDHLRRD